MESDQQFLESIVKAIVNNPSDVKVERKVDEMGVLLSLHVNPQDMGSVIGREGSTAKAIRTLLRIIGAKNNARVNLKIEEPEGSERIKRDDGVVSESAEAPVSNKMKDIDDVIGDLKL